MSRGWVVACLAAFLNGPLHAQDTGVRVLAPGDHAITLRHGGLLRRYVVHVPTRHPALPAVMLALHGGGGSGSQFKDENGLDAVADREGFLAIYPDGTGPLRNRLLTWNAGPDCCGQAAARNVDDVGFLARLLDDLMSRTRYDRRRVYATGHSNGAMMAYRLAAERADLVAAVVAVGGTIMVDAARPSRRVAVLDIHSVDDPRALYDGGLGPPFPGTDSRVLHRPVMAGLRTWATWNGCRGEPLVGTPIHGTGRDLGQTATRLRWSGCASGGPVEHLRLTGVGHGWPGVAARPALSRLLGPSTTLVEASDSAWAFASRFVR